MLRNVIATWTRSKRRADEAVRYVAQDDEGSSAPCLDRRELATATRPGDEPDAPVIKQDIEEDLRQVAVDLGLVLHTEGQDPSRSVPGARAVVVECYTSSVSSGCRRIQEAKRCRGDEPSPVIIAWIVDAPRGVEAVDEVPKAMDELRAAGADEVVWNARSEAELRLALDVAVRAAIASRRRKRPSCGSAGAPEKLKDAEDREPPTGMFWRSVHRTFRGFPQLDESLPSGFAEGVQVGPCVLGKRLGIGGFGVVTEAVNVETQALEAVKVVDKRGLQHVPFVSNLWREIMSMDRLDHPNVVKLHCAMQAPGHILLRMERVGARNLFQVLKRHRALPLEIAKDYMAQMVRGVAHCHRRQVAHRDLKPENIMASDCGRHLKIIDFGMAVESTAQCSSVVGTFPFVAPEVLELLSEQAGNETYAPCPVDIWALGVIMIELLAGVNRMKTLMGWESNVGPTVESRRDVEALFGVQGALERQWNERIGRELEPDALWLLEGMLAVKSHLRSTVGVVEASMWLSPASDQADAAAAIDVPDAQRAPSVSDKTVRAPLTPSPPAGVPTVSHRRRRHHVAGAAPANSEDRSSSPGTARGDIEGSGSTEALASAEALVGDPSASSPFISGDLDDRSRATARPPSAPSGHGRRPRRLVSVSERKSDRGASPGPPPACGVVGNISASAEATLAGLHPQ